MSNGDKDLLNDDDGNKSVQPANDAMLLNKSTRATTNNHKLLNETKVNLDEQLKVISRT